MLFGNPIYYSKDSRLLAVNTNDSTQVSSAEVIRKITQLPGAEKEVKDLRVERDKLVKQLTVYQEITSSIETKKKELEKLKNSYIKEAVKGISVKELLRHENKEEKIEK